MIFAMTVPDTVMIVGLLGLVILASGSFGYYWALERIQKQAVDHGFGYWINASRQTQDFRWRENIPRELDDARQQLQRTRRLLDIEMENGTQLRTAYAESQQQVKKLEAMMLTARKQLFSMAHHVFTPPKPKENV